MPPLLGVRLSHWHTAREPRRSGTVGPPERQAMRPFFSRIQSPQERPRRDVASRWPYRVNHRIRGRLRASKTSSEALLQHPCTPRPMPLREKLPRGPTDFSGFIHTPGAFGAEEVTGHSTARICFSGSSHKCVPEGLKKSGHAALMEGTCYQTRTSTKERACPRRYCIMYTTSEDTGIEA